MKRGSIYWVNLEDFNPPEFGKTRPGIVISNTEHNLRLPSVVVIPFSSLKPEIWPLRLKYELSQNKASYAVLPGMRQVSKKRLHEMIGTASIALLEKLDDALRAYLSD